MRNLRHSLPALAALLFISIMILILYKRDNFVGYYSTETDSEASATMFPNYNMYKSN